jgi:hypothetical protein
LDMPHDRHLLLDEINDDFTDNANLNEYEDDDDDRDAVDSAGMSTPALHHLATASIFLTCFLVAKELIWSLLYHLILTPTKH